MLTIFQNITFYPSFQLFQPGKKDTMKGFMNREATGFGEKIRFTQWQIAFTVNSRSVATLYNTQVYFTKEMPLAALGFPEGSTTA